MTTLFCGATAVDVGIQEEQLHHDIWNAAGGAGRVLNEMRVFLRDAVREIYPVPTMLVLAMDGNCRGYKESRDLLASVVEKAEYPGEVIYAVPDPHIERWYICDPIGLRAAIGGVVTITPPRYKCEKGVYKQVLKSAFRETGVIPPLGGAEYGNLISQNIDFYRVGKCDTAFRHFTTELKGALQRLQS
jgi:hypothetical protein